MSDDAWRALDPESVAAHDAAVEARVREQVARSIETTCPYDDPDEPCEACTIRLADAARLARGGTT